MHSDTAEEAAGKHKIHKILLFAKTNALPFNKITVYSVT